ncbi:hypothetical protein Entas_4544 (plasmid) [Enterobacter soli]|uniref:hypothetical protein n=1 Tax=Enterobacter soli TaxID=885040 RepID=UPI000223CEEB|nr:hypothetical protein [Enterobacter soli]AEN67227.1 hypothetical protein Entas_4544 [Enterobacter soli]OAT34981.1 hypothetical protein M987_04592 [Enterobacter soli ATCC BAA-2102]
MAETQKRPLSLKTLYDFRHLAILVLIFAIEMTVWAVLNQKGLGDKNFVAWRIWLLASVFITLFSGFVFYDLKAMEWVYVGALAPWLIAAASIIVIGFIQMNLHFLSMEWFFTCVKFSFTFQVISVFIFNATHKP